MSVASTHEVRLQNAELDIVMELLERELRGLPVEIHHTRGNDFRELLRHRLKVLEELVQRLQTA
jgi:hypothetical protein